jgi:hypothetical protein
MSLEILLWVKTDEIERNVAVSIHQKLPMITANSTLQKHNGSERRTVRVQRGTSCVHPKTPI